MKQCAFCPTKATKLSGEHIWDDWLNKELPTKEFRVRQRTSMAQPFREYQAKVLKEKLPVVCEACNNGWMSDITNSIKKDFAPAILKGAPVSLSLDKATLLATFAFMKSVVADHAVKGKEPFFTRADRANFMSSLSIPLGVQMWVAAYQGNYRYSGRCTTAILTATPPGPLDGLELYAFTYICGHLTVQTLTPRWQDVRYRVRPLPTVDSGQGWSQAVSKFWPYVGTAVQWPPPKYIGDDMFEPLINRFNPIRVRIA